MARQGSRPATMADLSVPPSTPAPAPVSTAPIAPTLASRYAQSSSVFHAFRRCWLLASTLGLLVGGVVGTYLWLSIPEQFSAEIRLRVPVIWSGAGGETAGEEEITRFQRTQAALIQSTTVLESVLKQPEVASLPAIHQEYDALSWLGNHLTIGFSSIPDIMLIRISGTRAEDAVVLVKTIAAVYLRTVTNQRQATLRQLQDARGRTEDTLRQKQQRLTQVENTRLAAAQKECQQAQFNLRVARAEYADLQRRRAKTETITLSDQAILSFLKEDQVFRKRLQELEDAEELIRKTIRVSAMKDHDPDLPNLYRLRDEARKRLEARRVEVLPLAEQNERSRAMADYQTQLNHRQERVAFYEGLVRSLEEEVQRLGGTAAEEEMKALREEIAAASESLRRLAVDQDRLERTPSPAEIALGGEMVAVQRLSTNGRLQPASLGGAGCCALLMLAVSWRELRLRRIISGSDIAAGVGLPVLGNIPVQRRKTSLTPEQLEGGGQLGEAVDALRTLILHDNTDGPRLLLVTSAVAREGKTSLAALLATSLARGWRKTLLVDADLRKPDAHNVFQTQLEPGLSEMLRGEAEAADVIQPTDLGRLWMIPAGQWDSHAIQALAQEGIGQLFDPLKEQFDFIVIDACPILPVADALLLSKHVDSVLLAIRSGYSRVPVIQAAQQRLLALDAPLRGAVLMGPDSDFHCKVFASSRRAG